MTASRVRARPRPFRHRVEQRPRRERVADGDDSERWRICNYGCMYLYMPLNAVDRWLGFGRGPASEPLVGLSR